MKKHFEWEAAVVEAVAESLDITYSDASGVVEAQPIVMEQSWTAGMDAEQTAIKVLAAAQAE